MNKQVIDAHIHLDHYDENEIEQIIREPIEKYPAMISVSYHLSSCKQNLSLAQKYSQVKPAFGFHPEQELPTEQERLALLKWMEEHVESMVAVGEIGLPYYTRNETPGLKMEGYIEVLEELLVFAKRWDKPVILHAVYDDADLVCDLLENHQITNAHFHWFKGADSTIERMIQQGYFISVTPDIGYEPEIQALVKKYPLEKIMVETDGPWPFAGPFEGKMTHPSMIHESVKMIAKIKGEELDSVYQQLYQNTMNFYRLS
ncbi:TatD family hydrolase [Lederbergia galactosidilytica]|uniref:DNAase n=1 Tax=Lederbergia galactosidilytica TaxID=217031 RepID=A0A178A8A8_9BACI|nr:TatD family hydrolase [Lederbergia galactosidilytica]KRG16232.1 DNAase [Virgibacillus soli]MBP1914057.1 TatD DNase family protein [Lederbergia galactosidilytica]OAK75660.1 DNAase [Lederbergia galactosidilytica]